MDKPEVVLLNKCDLIDEITRIRLVEALKKASGERVLAASGATGQGVMEALEAIWSLASATENSGWKA